MIKRVLMSLLLTVFFAAFFYLAYLIIFNYTSSPVPFKLQKAPSTIIINESSYTGRLQFFPNMRFPKKELSFSIDDECENEKRARIKEAFSFISSKTYLKFFETDSDGDIAVKCDIGIREEGERLIAGEGGPTKIINTSLFYVIEKGEINLFYDEDRCGNSNVERHELLHVLGFDHSNNPKSIMYNISDCDQELTQDIVDELNRLYSINELPELTFLNISAFKEGLYLDFSVEVNNVGLKDSENVDLGIYIDDKRIQKFPLKEIRYGEGKLLSVSNVYIGRGTKKISFMIDGGEEISKQNNIINLVLE